MNLDPSDAHEYSFIRGSPRDMSHFGTHPRQLAAIDEDRVLLGALRNSAALAPQDAENPYLSPVGYGTLGRMGSPRLASQHHFASDAIMRATQYGDYSEIGQYESLPRHRQRHRSNSLASDRSSRVSLTKLVARFAP